jgi:predicted RNA-binding protein YlqC (UPF0109 family)
MRQQRVTNDIARELGVLLATIVSSLVEDRDAVSVDVDKKSHRVALTLETADADSGRVIGNKGRTIMAIREILFAAARTAGVTVDIEYLNDRT